MPKTKHDMPVFREMPRQISADKTVSASDEDLSHSSLSGPRGNEGVQPSGSVVEHPCNTTERSTPGRNARLRKQHRRRVAAWLRYARREFL